MKSFSLRAEYAAQLYPVQLRDVLLGDYREAREETRGLGLNR